MEVQRTDSERRPIGGFILSLAGSLFVFVGTILGYMLLSTGNVPTPPTNLIPFLVGITVLFAGLMLVTSLLLYLRPELRLVWGVMLVVFAFASLTGTSLGFAGLGLGMVGSVLGFIGGLFAVMWKPGIGVTGVGTGSAYRVCSNCYRWIPIATPYCPMCGAPATIPTPPAAGSPSESPPR